MTACWPSPHLGYLRSRIGAVAARKVGKAGGAAKHRAYSTISSALLPGAHI